MAEGKGKADPAIRAAMVEEHRQRRRNRGTARDDRRGGDIMGVLSLFPLLTIPVVVYNLMTFLGNSADQSLPERLGATLWAIPMASGATWNVTPGDILVLISLVLLFIELIKSTHTGSAAIINHGLSLIIFIVCLIEFLLLQSFATSVFFAIMTMALLDTLAGVIVTITAARRDFSVSEDN